MKRRGEVNSLKVISARFHFILFLELSFILRTLSISRAIAHTHLSVSVSFDYIPLCVFYFQSVSV